MDGSDYCALYFWAKTNGDGLPGLSVRDHCLNVGCVAEALRKQLPSAVLRLLPPGTVTLIALHDVGKISPGFLRKCEWWRALFETKESEPSWGQREKNHAAVSHAIIGQWLGKQLAGYAIAAGGHHGFFVDNGHEPRLGQGGNWRLEELDDAMLTPPRNQLRDQLATVFGEDLPTVALNKKQETLIVFLTGFMTFADWLGSNEAFFKLEPATFKVPLPLAVAAAVARKRAAEIVAWLRWGRTEIRMARTFTQLFPFEPKPIQQRLVELAERPGLFIVEAPMGGGKTEAALAAAYRRWSAPDGERGLYFALPTQLTSERIFDRVKGFLSQALAAPDLIALVHGSAWLREDRVLEIHPASPEPAGAELAAEYARDAKLWFASARQALLAPFGAGTIDQALLGVLPAKHCGLRLFGLAGKVVILDEVHSYDHYTGTLVDHLVADLLRLNSTVIVLSATLTAERKRALLLSAGVVEENLPTMAESDSYPMITSATRGAESNHTWKAAVTTVPWEETPKVVQIDHAYADQEYELWEEAYEAAQNGACVLIIRNTVASAQATWRMLKQQGCEDGPPVALLHSRFPRWRRNQLESKWIRRLGRGVLERWKRRFGFKKFSPRRKGCLLVATQVVEQSVDIDADLLITDLAPTDLLFQRIGRLHRHMPRRPESFDQPRTIIIHPNLADSMDAKALKAAFGSSGFVYAPYTLWRSFQQWHERSTVQIPQDIRPWMEATYASVAHGADEPAALELLEQSTRVTEKHSTTAKKRTSRLRAQGQPDEEGVLTRWNSQPTAQVLLLKSKPGHTNSVHEWTLHLLDGQKVLIPYGRWDLAAAKAIHTNVVRVPAYTVQTWMNATPLWLKDYLPDQAVLGVVEGNNVLPISESEMPYKLTWQKDEGVAVAKQSGRSQSSPAEPEDGWW